jgi:hypothetical protein
VQFNGLTGGRNDFSTDPIPTTVEPNLQGNPAATGGSGTTFTVIVNGVAMPYNFIGNFV